MNKYLVQIRIKGQIIKTVLFADSVIHAKLIAEYNYGFNTVVSNPTRLAETTATPKTPQQARIKSLQQQKDNVSKALKAERARQTMAKAQKQMVDIK